MTLSGSKQDQQISCWHLLRLSVQHCDKCKCTIKLKPAADSHEKKPKAPPKRDQQICSAVLLIILLTGPLFWTFQKLSFGFLLIAWALSCLDCFITQLILSLMLRICGFFLGSVKIISRCFQSTIFWLSDNCEKIRGVFAVRGHCWLCSTDFIARLMDLPLLHGEKCLSVVLHPESTNI